MGEQLQIPSNDAPAAAVKRARLGAATASPDLFTPVNPERPASLIVEQVRWLVHSGQLRSGDRLPAERELSQLFGVSRVTVREAIRVLEANGMVEVQLGIKGGSYIKAPTGVRVRDEITDLLAMSTLKVSDVVQARQILEIGIIPMVCECATDEDITDLMELCETAQRAWLNNEYSMSMSTEFHIRVARASHNSAIELLIESLGGAVLASQLVAAAAGPVPGRSSGDEHIAFVEAVRRRDVKAATAIMTKHLQRTADLVRVDTAHQKDSAVSCGWAYRSRRLAQR